MFSLSYKTITLVQYRPDLFVKDPFDEENILKRINWSDEDNENQRKDQKENSKNFSLKLAFVTRYKNF